jgi:hypothetical protein
VTVLVGGPPVKPLMSPEVASTVWKENVQIADQYYWVDYNLMSNIPGQHFIGGSNLFQSWSKPTRSQCSHGFSQQAGCGEERHPPEPEFRHRFRLQTLKHSNHSKHHASR